ARAAEQAEDLAALDFQADVVDGDEVAELARDVLDPKDRRARRSRGATVPVDPRFRAHAAADRSYLPVLKRVHARVSSRWYSCDRGGSGTSFARMSGGG